MRQYRVFVYRNLHNDCFSVRSVDTGRVIAHVKSVQVSDARFIVSEAGRQRVLREKRKNVHAGVEGVLVMDPTLMWRPCRTRVVTYNPLRGPHFTDQQGKPVHESKFAWLKDGKVHIP